MSDPDVGSGGDAASGGVGARLDRLWTPWRMSYIGTGRPEGCIFCVKPAENRDEEHLILGSCLLYTSPSPRDGLLSRMPSSA